MTCVLITNYCTRPSETPSQRISGRLEMTGRIHQSMSEITTFFIIIRPLTLSRAYSVAYWPLDTSQETAWIMLSLYYS